MLEIRLLGGFDVRLDGEPVHLPDRAEQSLLAYLVLTAGTRHRREKLAGLLWPDFDEPRARKNLNNYLFRLRQAVGVRYVEGDRVVVGWQSGARYQLDVSPLLDLRPQDLELDRLIQVLDMYLGDLLPGFFDEWLLLYREACRVAFEEGMDALVNRLLDAQRWGDTLTQARRWVGLNPVSETGYRALMLAHFAQGDSAQSASAYQQCEETLQQELGVAPSGRTREVYEFIRAGDVPPGLPPDIVPERAIAEALPPNPYRGLAAFREADAPYFHGRESFTERLADLVERQGLVTVVVGSSGAGKSSVTYAGLVPRLQDDGRWLVADMRPGARPFEALGSGLTRLLNPHEGEAAQLVEAGRLAQALSTGDILLVDVVTRALQVNNNAQHVLLLVDQFEELYTLCPEIDTRHAFIDGLLAATHDQRPDRPLAAVLTMRADFMEQALAYRPFADSLQEGALLLGPMNRTELQRAIEEPARAQGVGFAIGLVDRLLDDMGAEPGNLPLLEFALTLMWERQRAGRLTHASYEDIGRVDGALVGYAEAVYARLSDSDQEHAQRVFIQLVRPGEGTEDTRRRATQDELGAAGWTLVQRLADERLVVTGLDAEGLPVVEVVHEALIRRWGRLREWMEADRAFRGWQERLRTALRGWEESRRDEGALLRGAQLVVAEQWLAEREDELSPAEADYIRASSDLRAREQATRERRRRQLISGLVAGLVITLLLAGLAALQWQRARREEQEARRQASVGLAAQAIQELEGKFPERAVPLALEALENYPYTWQAERALGQAALESRLSMILRGHEGIIRYAALSPDGKLITTASYDSTVRIWDANTGDELFVLSGHTGRIYHAAWSPDGSQIVSACSDGTSRIWDASTGDEWLVLSGHTGQVATADWSPDGRQIVTASLDGTARIWNAATGQELFILLEGSEVGVWTASWSPSGDRVVTGDMAGTAIVWDAKTGTQLFILDGHDDLISVANWSPDGSQIVTGSDDFTARVWDATTGEEHHTLTGHTNWVLEAAWSPSGDRIATASQDTSIRMWDTATGEELFKFAPGEGWVEYGPVAWSPDGDQIAVSRFDSRITILNAATGDQILTLSGNPGKLTDLLWFPDGDRIVSVAEDATARVWDVSPRAQELTGLPPESARVAWSPSGDRLATAAGGWSADKSVVQIWDMISDEIQHILYGQPYVGRIAWSPSGDRIVANTHSSGREGLMLVWDATTGEVLLEIEAPLEGNGVSWSPTGDRIATASGSSARVWDATTGDELFKFEGHSEGAFLYRAEFSPDGQLILSCDLPGDIFVWDAQTGDILHALHETTSVTEAAWSPDGTQFATYSEDGRIWDATTGEALLTLTGHTAQVSGMDWSSSGDRLLTTSNDGTAIIWDTHTGAALLSYSFGPPFSDGDWSPDDRRIAFGFSDGMVRVVDVNWQTPAALIAYARQCCLFYELTPGERDLFGLPPADAETSDAPAPDEEASHNRMGSFAASFVAFGLVAVGLAVVGRRLRH